ncbi:MAG: hypothetical protein ABF289_13600 [Clostridiales bacterium]
MLNYEGCLIKVNSVDLYVEKDSGVVAFWLGNGISLVFGWTQ